MDMNLLEIARGPGLSFALAVFGLGTLWRLVGVLSRPGMRDLSPAREGAPSKLAGALHANLRAKWPRKEFAPSTRYVTLELLLVWFPFGKLMHAFLFVFSRGATGMRFSHRGVTR